MGLLPDLSYTFEPADVAIFFTLILLEGILSFDNAAVLAVMVRKLPHELQRKALFYGLAGAYVFRIAAILLASFLIDNPVLRIIGGGYLVYLAVRHVIAHGKKHAEVLGVRRILGLSPFWSTIVLVETADLVFAIDQIVVAVALTDKIVLIIAAALLAIVALRLSAIFMIRLMTWFPALEHLAYLAVFWVGLKLLVVELFDADIPKTVSLIITFTILILPILGKAFLDLAKKSRKKPAEAPRPPSP